MYFTGPYVLQLKRGVYINAARTDSVGRYINCARNVRNRAGELVPQVNDWNEPLLTNCQFVPNFRARPQKAMVRATKYIPADSELFIAYGRGYSLPTGVLRIPKHDPREAPRKPAMPAKPAKGTKNNPIVL